MCFTSSLPIIVGSLTDSRFPQGPRWKTKEKLVLCPCERAILTSSNWGWSLGLEGVKVFVPGNWLSPPEMLWLLALRQLCLRTCIIFANTIWFSFMLTLAISPLLTVYKMMYLLINLLGISHSFCKTSWPQLSIFSFTSPLSLRILTLKMACWSTSRTIEMEHGK